VTPVLGQPVAGEPSGRRTRRRRPALAWARRAAALPPPTRSAAAPPCAPASETPSQRPPPASDAWEQPAAAAAPAASGSGGAAPRGRRSRPTWRRAGQGRAAAPERPPSRLRPAAPTPAPNLAGRPRSTRGRSAGVRAARQARDPQLRRSPGAAARRPEPWNRRRSST
jgi:hypothetical protein